MKIISNKQFLKEYQLTYLKLQRALLKANMTKEMEQTGKTYAKTKKIILERISKREL